MSKDHRLVAIVLTFACLSWPARAAESPLQFWAAQVRPSVSPPLSRHDGKSVVGGIVRASWYGGAHERLSRYTASGELFRPWARTAAHRSLPFGTRLEVTYRGRSTIVTVNDRGPAAYTGRSLDLSRGAASDLGMFGAGAALVAIRIVN
jgi:rare lipoprotein A